MWSSNYYDGLSENYLEEVEEMEEYEKEHEMEETSQFDTTMIKENQKMKANDMLIKAWTKILTLDRDRRGQGTVEYVILVGVLVVIAIIAIAAFSGKIGEMWGAIGAGIDILEVPTVE